MRLLPIQSLFLLLFHAGFAQSSVNEFSIPGIPEKLHWLNAPKQWNYRQGTLEILAGEKTDLFIDPRHEYAVANSPKAVFPASGGFQLSAKVKIGFASDFDAGVLVIYAGDDAWAKLCFEFSPQKKPFIVSVVNNSVSDDCNHISHEGNTIYLRVAGLGKNIFAFHYSLDGKYWYLVRYFLINTSKPIMVGFSSQSPTGKSCNAVFTEIRYAATTLTDIRNGK